MSMLKIVMGFLNLGQTISLNPPPPEQPLISCGLFEVVVSTQETIKGLLKARVFLFHRFHVENVDSIDPLMCGLPMNLGFQTWVFWHNKF